ncbi:hypothetical protein BGZ60DRAFT_398796 [Tricladium varicosporioides]|nr:hypothetical protein BGZ60DRAFT_398796 [Hymenoscyphus varicosporioides]
MPLKELASGATADGKQSPTIDIIAVHGLNPKGKNNHAINTWTKKRGGSNRIWLQDDLPRDMPDARVLLYEYDSFPVLTSTKTRFVHQASDLLYCLDMERDTCPDRPLIFLAHSLGGILVKQALVNANNDPSYIGIKNSTRGLAFFGTPHAGGNDTLVSFGRSCAAIVNAVTGSAPNDLMEVVSSGSLYTDILQDTWRHQLNDYRIISFYEGLGNIVPRESAVFNMPGDIETPVRIDATHSEMCRFDTSVNADLDNYHKVRHGIRKLRGAALNHLSVILPTPPSTIPTQPPMPPFPSSGM